MTTAIVIGDGPAGLSAALFLAKNGVETVVLGEDETAMHWAYLRNYLGIDEIGGTAFQRVARAQVEGFGAKLLEAKATEVTHDGERFTVRGDDGTEASADYLVLAGARQSARLAQELGADVRDGAIVVDDQQRTSLDRLYGAGRAVRPHRSQAIISAGAGAVAAVDILSRERGEEFHDWDTPEDG